MRYDQWSASVPFLSCSFLGEVVSLDLVSRFFDYCYEKEVIDESENGFVLSEAYKHDDNLISFMYNILQFR